MGKIIANGSHHWLLLLSLSLDGVDNGVIDIEDVSMSKRLVVLAELIKLFWIVAADNAWLIFKLESTMILPFL